MFLGNVAFLQTNCRSGRDRSGICEAVEKLPLQNYYPADEYHQDYLDKHPNGYCHLPKALFDFARKAKDMK